jgi:peptide methionine sulfoxide reductase msrA/msrB
MKNIILILLLFYAVSAKEKVDTATFAGGCFWCMEPPFEKIKGVKSVVSGYTGGIVQRPTYEAVSSGKTGHFEAIQIEYDALVVPYDTLLAVFWRQIDPTDSMGQFVDKGTQYRTAIFYHSPLQKEIAEKSKRMIDKSSRFNSPVVTLVISAPVFYKAEEYHQNYYKKDPFNYSDYKKDLAGNCF